MNHELKT